MGLWLECGLRGVNILFLLDCGYVKKEAGCELPVGGGGKGIA